jgi:DNA-binding transcriptional ArsR family regulator
VEALVVLHEPRMAALVMDPVRRSLLAALREPASAGGLAATVSLSRQRITYYLGSLQKAGLIDQVGEKQWGGITERMYQATAASYAVSPEVLGELAGSPRAVGDKLSAHFAIALASRVIHEVGALLGRATTDRRRLATLSLDTTIRFATAADRKAFADELAADVRALAATYHRADAASGRDHRLVVLAYPVNREAA